MTNILKQEIEPEQLSIEEVQQVSNFGKKLAGNYVALSRSITPAYKNRANEELVHIRTILCDWYHNQISNLKGDAQLNFALAFEKALHKAFVREVAILTHQENDPVVLDNLEKDYRQLWVHLSISNSSSSVVSDTAENQRKSLSHTLPEYLI